MALPFILSLLGSTAAGAGMLGTMSPLIAGALGSGLGSAIETGSLEEGLKTGLTAGILGGLGGAMVGGAGGATAGQAASEAARPGIMGMFQNLPSGFQPGVVPGIDAATMAGRMGQIGAGAGQVPLGQVLQGGFQQGAMTGAGLGTALGGAMMTQPPQMDTGSTTYERPGIDPETRRRSYAAPANYQHGQQGEFTYFDPWVPNVQGYAEGGVVAPGNRMDEEEEQKRRMLQLQIPGINMGLAKALSSGNYGLIQQLSGGNVGGLLGMAEGGQVQGYAEGGIVDMAPPQERTQMNEKQLVQAAIQAVSGALPEAEASVVLGQFLQTFGEDALRQLVDDVRSGRAKGPRGDVEGPVQGPGDGMADMVPATMDDGSQDVLLSDGEFVVPADVVSGLGNGSTDAGADELHKMMDRVRQERTGMREQPKRVAVGGLMPA